MPSPQSRPAAPPPYRSAGAERLYVYWLATTMVLLLACFAILAYTAGARRDYLARAQELQKLQGRVAQLETELRAARSAATHPTPPPPDSPAPRFVPPDSGNQRPADHSTLTPPTPAPRAATEPNAAPSPLTEAAVQRTLTRLLGENPVTPADVADSNAGVALVDQAVEQPAPADWSGRTWQQLAMLARLVNRDAGAEMLARRAEAKGEWLTPYAELAARGLLIRGRPQDARAVLERWARPLPSGGIPATARVLMAAALLGTSGPAAADIELSQLDSTHDLGPYELLRLGRLWLALERWPRLETLLAAVPPLPDDLATEYGFLQAASLARSGKGVEALAILDYLAAHPPTPPEPGLALLAWPPIGPDRYELAVWRGLALTYAQKPEPAREILQDAAQLDPARPDAYYYRGMLEIRQARLNEARAYLESAVANAPQYAPAWEALAYLDFGAGKLERALKYLASAVESNPRRAPTHFLLAIVQASAGRRPEATTALQTALRLDPSYLIEAQRADIFQRMFTPAELEQMAAPAGAAPPASAPASQPLAEPGVSAPATPPAPEGNAP
jgi:tetratricopeptide (TPR) repeat protein